MILANIRRHIALFLLLAVVILGSGTFISNAIFEQRLRETSLKRSETIANMLNHAAETLLPDEDLQRLVSVLSGESDVEFVLVIGCCSPRVIASSYHRWIGMPLENLPLEPDLIQDIKRTMESRQKVSRLNKEALAADYLAPIVLTQPIVRGQGTGLIVAAAIIRLDLRNIYNMSMITSITTAALLISSICGAGLILLRLHRRRTARVVRSIISTIKQAGREEEALPIKAALPPEVSEMANELIYAFIALHSSEQRLRFALDAGNIWACEWDLSTDVIVWCEDRGLLFDETQTGNEVKSFSDILSAIHPDDRHSIDIKIRNSILDRVSFAAEFRTVCADGTLRWVSCSGKLIKRHNKDTMILTGVDVTKRKQFESTIASQQAKLIASSKMSALGEMAGGIAHEINNPLAIIDGKAKQLKIFLNREPVPTDMTIGAVEIISNMTRRIAKIIRGLRTFSRNTDMDPFESVKVKTIVDETLSFCSERFNVYKIQLIVDNFPSDLELECRATEISQVLLNLLSNAFDAVVNLTERWVRISCAQISGAIEISIMDSGKGIPGDIRSKLGQPFFTTKEVGKGTGLGLSVSKAIVEAHNGSLNYDEASPNTRFVMQLPISQSKFHRIQEGPKN